MRGELGYPTGIVEQRFLEPLLVLHWQHGQCPTVSDRSGGPTLRENSVQGRIGMFKVVSERS